MDELFTRLVEKEKKMMISVIVPVYNAQRYLHRCIESLLGQTYRNIEIICIDDGSEDDSLVILKKYEENDKRVLVISKKNEGTGAASARNLGLKYARGDYILFIDSDDYVAIDALGKFMNKIEETAADIVICDALSFDVYKTDEKKGYSGIRLELSPQKDVFTYKDCVNDVFQMAGVVVWNKIYKKSLLNQYEINFDLLRGNDDWNVAMLPLILANKISVVREALVFYQNNGSDSQTSDYTEYSSTICDATYYMVKRFKKLGVYNEIKQSFLNHVIACMRNVFDTITVCSIAKRLYRTYKYEMLKNIEAEDIPKEYFYDFKVYCWYRMLQEYDFEEIMFRCARGYGSRMTTAILRFQIPYNDVEIPLNSRVVLIGNEPAIKLWHAQLILSGLCNVVFVGESEKNIPSQISYDLVIKTI